MPYRSSRPATRATSAATARGEASKASTRFIPRSFISALPTRVGHEITAFVVGPGLAVGRSRHLQRGPEGPSLARQLSLAYVEFLARTQGLRCSKVIRRAGRRLPLEAHPAFDRHGQVQRRARAGAVE